MCRLKQTCAIALHWYNLAPSSTTHLHDLLPQQTPVPRRENMCCVSIHCPQMQSASPSSPHRTRILPVCKCIRARQHMGRDKAQPRGVLRMLPKLCFCFCKVCVGWVWLLDVWVGQLGTECHHDLFRTLLGWTRNTPCVKKISRNLCRRSSYLTPMYTSTIGRNTFPTSTHAMTTKFSWGLAAWKKVSQLTE